MYCMCRLSTNTPLFQLMFMVDPLHQGNPKESLGSQMNTLLADKSLFRQGPSLSVWVSLTVLLSDNYATCTDGVPVVVVRSAAAKSVDGHGSDGERTSDARV